MIKIMSDQAIYRHNIANNNHIFQGLVVNIKVNGLQIDQQGSFNVLMLKPIKIISIGNRRNLYIIANSMKQ